MLLDGDLVKDDEAVGGDDPQEEGSPCRGDAAVLGTGSSLGSRLYCSTAGGVDQAPAGGEADSHLCSEVEQGWWCLREVGMQGGQLAGEAGHLEGSEGSGWRGLSRSDQGQGWSDVTSEREKE